MEEMASALYRIHLNHVAFYLVTLVLLLLPNPDLVHFLHGPENAAFSHGVTPHIRN
jgi:hypothetical protein